MFVSILMLGVSLIGTTSGWAYNGIEGTVLSVLKSHLIGDLEVTLHS
jgi:hypothetical protein